MKLHCIVLLLGVVFASCQSVSQQQTVSDNSPELQSVVLNDPEDKSSAVLLGTANGSRVIVSSQQLTSQNNALSSMKLKGANITLISDGVKIAFENDLMFDKGSSSLTRTAKQNLSKLVKTIKSFGNSKLSIEGYSDNAGQPEYNLKLSQQRAQAVADYLKKKSIPATRIDVKGYGENNPVYENDTEKGRQLNRRVEIKVINK